jgi:hypothetical protein
MNQHPVTIQNLLIVEFPSTVNSTTELAMKPDCPIFVAFGGVSVLMQTPNID